MPYSQRTRTERQISFARLTLAGFSLLAMLLDSDEVGHHADTVYPLVVGFVVYSFVVVLLVPRATLYLSRLQIVTHAIDIVGFSAFIYLTEGATSLFYVYFVFTLVAATLRWQWRGTLVTAAFTLVAFFGFALLNVQMQHDPGFDLGRLVIGIVYLAIVAWLLAFLGIHEARLRREVGQLAIWSRDVGLDDALGAPRSRWLARAANTMGVRRVVFAWEDEEEPWLQIALWEDGHTALSRAAPDEFSPLVAPDLEDAVFMCADARGGPAAVTLYGTEDHLQRRRGPPIHRAFADKFEMGTVISAPVGAEAGTARLFFLDRPRISSDDLALANIVAGGVTLLTVDSHLRLRVRESAVFEERVRLARDLHDGVLQSLAGAALQLETARRLLADDPPAARKIIENVQGFLAQEQRDLRRFVDALRPERVRERATTDLRRRLVEVRDRVSGQWGLDVEVLLEEGLEQESGTTSISADDLASDIALIVREGLVNSARHAEGTRAWATVRYTSDTVEIVLGDDGHGFAFLGRLDRAALRDLEMGPRSLMQRVEARGGTLTVDSSARGSRIEIILPADAHTAGLRKAV